MQPQVYIKRNSKLVVKLFYFEYNCHIKRGDGMTTGEKLAKLRKENKYTQEQLAEVIGVSRQSISKWESDGAFPETEKLIILSRLYKCSIDYLLKEEIEEEKLEPKQTKGINFDISKNLLKDLPTSLWSMGCFLLMLIFYLLKVVDFSGGCIVHYLNYYQLTKLSTLHFILVLLSIILEIAIFVISIIIYCVNIDKKLFKIRKILSIFTLCIYLFILLTIIKSFSYGMILIIILSIINLVGLFVFNFNKYKEKENE
jgi:transcriptional regulator with XRE-family HTH domain